NEQEHSYWYNLARRTSKITLRLLLWSRLFHANPGWGVIAGAGLAAHPRIDTSIDQLGFEGSIEQKMINPQTGVSLPMLTEVIPESVNTLLRQTRPQGIRPTLSEEALITVAGLRL